MIRVVPAHVGQLEAGDVLALGREAVRRARPSPIRPAVVGDKHPLLRSSQDLLAVVRVDAHLADGVVLRELAGRLRVRGAEHVFPEHRPGRSGVGRLQDALAPHRERAIVEVTRTCVDGVVVVRIDVEGVDRERGDERVLGRSAPRGRVAAAVGRLPDPAADRGRIGDDRARVGRRRIDGHRIDATLGEAVVVATRTAGHPFRLRTQTRPRGRRVAADSRPAARDTRVLRLRGAQPSRVEVTGRIRQPVVPVRVHGAELLALPTARNRHVCSG